jgi:hypothetical protein
VQTRLFARFCVFLVALVVIACNKAQNPDTPTPAHVVPASNSAASAPTDQSVLHFAGEVREGQSFEKSFAPDMVFRLEPYAGKDSGWTIRIAPGRDSIAATMDCIGAVTEPLHGNTGTAIDPPEGGRLDDPWKRRDFNYAANASDCRAAWRLMNEANYASKLSDKEREQASTKLGQIRTTHARFSILDARSAAAAAPDVGRRLKWLKFDVDLNAGAGTAADSSPDAAGKSAGIRDVEVRPFVETHLGALNPDLAELDIACGEGKKPLQSLAPVLYGDLDGDGQEEAVVEGWSCLSGNGGADFRGVLKLMPDGKLSVLPIEAMPKVFKGRNAYADLRGHMVVEIKNSQLHEVYAIYTGAEANCCPEGGERRFIYRWDGHRFVLDDMIDVPPAKSGN